MSQHTENSNSDKEYDWEKLWEYIHLWALSLNDVYAHADGEFFDFLDGDDSSGGDIV